MIRWSGGRQKYTFVAGREGFKNLIIVKKAGMSIFQYLTVGKQLFA
jgi:hypothetical protein